MAKVQVLRSFFMIGILEQFVDTLTIFQKMLPSYYNGVIDIWNSDCKLFNIPKSDNAIILKIFFTLSSSGYLCLLVLQAKRNSTKTMNRKELSLESREFLMLGPLKWETDLYVFIRALFNERLRRYGITPHEVQMTRK